MGDSSACLMQQPFCYASGFPKEANKSNQNHALGQSISFGRFMSESLAWDKWSTFSQNRYVEEAKSFTQSGSVAQKKAFFEAHYKKLAAQKAAALLEQQANSASQTQQEHEADNNHNSHMMSPKSKLVLQNAKVYNSNSTVETTLPQSNKLEGAQPEIDHQTFVVKLQNQLQKVDNSKDPSEEGTNFDQEILQPIGKKKQPVSSFKLLKFVGTSKFNSTPVKSTTPSLSKKDDIATPMSNKSALSSSDKEKSTAKSPHMSLNFTIIREINKLTVSLARKFESTRVGASSSKASKDSSNILGTKTKASKNDLQKHSSSTPLSEAKRSERTPPIKSPTFSLSTEERASSRKKEKTEIKIRKLRQSFCFKPRLPPDFYKEREESKTATKKDQLVTHESSKKERRPTLRVVESKSSLPRMRPFKEKNCATLTMPFTSNSPMNTTHENTSPNIQHGNQNDKLKIILGREYYTTD
ncbi:protein WVD2-like 7 [Cajanus cajan]|uniref:protein WVD2-like 7 n=1 Tax=Cajanus cajan TaxID=3821 RepID=UPI00098DB88E|nr:protein WVD2-like 7 [Cajanus cajan]